MSQLSANSPWSTDDLTRSLGLTFLGLIGLGSCWYGISGEANYRTQVAWVVGAVGAVVLGGFGILRLLLAGMREVHREIHAVADQIRTQELNLVPLTPVDEFDIAAEPQQSRSVQLDVFAVAPSMTRAHRPDCQLIKGRAVEIINPEEIERRGLGYCGVCT